jgi:hypothetical protein
MLVVVVNEVLPNGWLEFLHCVDFDSSKRFDAVEEAKRNVRGAALAILEVAKQDAVAMELKAKKVEQEEVEEKGRGKDGRIRSAAKKGKVGGAQEASGMARREVGGGQAAEGTEYRVGYIRC